MKHSYGNIPSKPDIRDDLYNFRTLGLAQEALPISADLRKYCSPVRDQGQLGSCTWESMTAFREFVERKVKVAKPTLSVLFGYYNTRCDEGTSDQDSGCELRDCWKQLQKTGTCLTKYWPYSIKKFAKKPSANAYSNSIYKISSYHALSSSNDIKTCLASGWPVVIGFTVYDSFESDAVAATGIMPMPKRGEQVLGGHAVVVVGYDDSKQWFIVRNSWGKTWGDKGYFYMPYQFVTAQNVSDMWTALV
ncbi:MAG: C1 family peptidase [Anaerolineaceae bacterium]|nr:C1 family peptidase [Anaerolineaceae bacterium]